MRIVGTLLWPDDQNDSTPEPDLAGNIWFARNVETMSEVLDTQPLMVVASQTSPADPRLTPLPVNTASIKNDHFAYAVTWFLLAAVWAAMSLFLISRTTRQKDA
jgi:surfeit locus 1 family protein